MSLLGRIKSALSSSANAALDGATDPRKEMDQIIRELEEQVRQAKKELVGYKATQKQIARDIETTETQLASWEKRAMDAVRAGNDELAKEALRAKRQCQEEKLRLVRDRNEAASYAIEINRARKEAENRLRMLKLKKGTMAQQIAAARSGGKVFGDDGEVWDRFREAEEKIDEQAIAAEVQELLGDEAAGDGAGLDLATRAAEADADAALAQLKAKMGGDEKPLLRAGDPEKNPE